MTYPEMQHWINIVKQEAIDEPDAKRILSDPDELAAFMKLYGYPDEVPELRKEDE